MSEKEVELPADPEDGLTPAAVSALHTFALMPEGHDQRYDRLTVLAQWFDWAADRDPTRDRVADLVAVRDADGDIAVRRPSRRLKPLVIAELPATLQSTMLEAAPGVAPETAGVVALMCIDEIVRELLGVHADPEQLYGHLALVHGMLADTSATHRDRSAEHRLAHLVGDVFVGHHGIAHRPRNPPP